MVQKPILDIYKRTELSLGFSIIVFYMGIVKCTSRNGPMHDKGAFFFEKQIKQVFIIENHLML